MKKFPTAFTILFGLIVVVAALTWIIPAGQYERAMNETLGKEAPVPGTYAQVEPNPQGLGAVLMAPIAGLYDPDDRHGERRRRRGLRAGHRRLPGGGDEDRGDRRRASAGC